jgi:hypothetical protein
MIIIIIIITAIIIIIVIIIIIIIITCDPSLDSRREVTLRIDAADRSFVIPSQRTEEDPQLIISCLREKDGFTPDQYKTTHGFQRSQNPSLYSKIAQSL